MRAAAYAQTLQHIMLVCLCSFHERRGVQWRGIHIGHAQAGLLAVFWASCCTSSHGKLPSATPLLASVSRPTIAAPYMAQPWLHSHSTADGRHRSIQSLQTSDSLSWVCRGRHGWRTCHTFGVHHLRAPATAPRIFPRAQRCVLPSVEAVLLLKERL